MTSSTPAGTAAEFADSAPADGRRLGPRDWQRAALAALIDSGLAGVTVPRLATALGVTKGSFYWHFKSLDALLAAAVERWELVFTDQRLAEFAKVADPVERLRPWFAEIAADHPAQRLHLAIASAAGHPVIGPVFARVAEKRIAFIAAALRDLGIAPDVARARAVAAHASYLGYLRLARAAPATLGDRAARQAAAADVLAKLVRTDAPAAG